MFDKPYRFEYLGTKETLLQNPVQISLYRFKAKHRRYIVNLEIFDFDVIAVKYCDIRDKLAGNRFEKIFNEGDAFRVITTCLYIILDYWRKNPQATFAFYAIPRAYTDEVLNEKITKGNFLERYTKVRFTIYKYAMINLFPPKYFIQLSDSKNCIYVLLNKKQKKPKTSIKLLGKYLLDNCEMIFELDGN